MTKAIERLGPVGDLLEKVGDRVRDQDWDEVRHRVESFVDARPITAVAIAAIAGFAVGRILR